MIEFNLLPDIKQQFIKARRTKRLIVSLSIIVGGIAIAIFILLLLYVDVFQKARINSLKNQINNSNSQLASNTNLNKILTIQNQLNTLPTIYKQLPASNRLFNYLTELLPVNATVSSLSVDFTKDTVNMSGTADSAETINQFIDTLNFANYTVAGSTASTPAFSAITVGSISVSNSTNSTNYSLTFNFDPRLFNSQYNTQLIVPSLTTTRSILNQPTDIFK